MEAVGYGVVESCKCLWGSLTKPISYICNPTKKLKLLEREMQRLMNKSADIGERVEIEEAAQMSKRTNQVAGWLKEVQDLKGSCDQVLEEGYSHQQSKCLVRCYPGNCWSNYKLGKKISRLCDDMRECQSAGKFTVLVTPLPPPLVREMPLAETVGLDSMLSQVWSWLQEEHVGIIGLWGMGGVGKTTLLKKINEEFRCKSHEFHVVLWIVVSKHFNLDKTRESIRRNLGIEDNVWRDRSEEEKAAELCKVLNKKKFVLLIDDIWERLDVAKIGIPIPNSVNGSKIVFTTRLEELCGEMEAKKRLKVKCLSFQQAFELFDEKVGRTTLNLHQDIRKYAEDIVKECKGLPLALTTIGRAMATKENPREWEHVSTILRSYPSKFSKMENEVYKLLKFSYDSLKDTKLQQCFLYCALFPEDSIIHNDHLIDLWIGEGFLFDANDTYEARLDGEFVIRSLKSACLLEQGEFTSHVKMHDMIRDMALWIAREHRKEENKIIVEEDVCIFRWKEAERVSLQGHKIRIDHVTELSACSRLVTLLINETELETLPEGFFNPMHVLKVLDMSSNRRLTNLPIGIGRLVKLQYLNLSGTKIKVLPDEIKHLTSLLYLLLDHMRYLEYIPKNVISSLLFLKVFRMRGRSSCLDKRRMVELEWLERGLVEGLVGLDHLDELSLEVCAAFSVQRLLESPNLQRSITSLSIHHTFDLPAIKVPTSSLRRILRLNRLQLGRCDSLEGIEIYEDIPRHVNDLLSGNSKLTNLRFVHIYACNKLRNLSWLIYAPRIQELIVRICNSLEKIIDEDILHHIDENASARLFSSLTSLDLINLPKLRSIHKQTLTSPSLTTIDIYTCPSLKRLPFDSNSGKNSLEVIKADPAWWSGLEWDDEAAKTFFTSKLDLRW